MRARRCVAAASPVAAVSFSAAAAVSAWAGGGAIADAVVFGPRRLRANEALRDGERQHHAERDRSERRRAESQDAGFR
jgi:hypothetical protein